MARAVWVLDRPNPAGRPVEGTTLIAGLGKLRRRGADPDAPRADAGRARPLVHRPFQARRRLSRDRDGGLCSPTPRPASAGRPTGCGSTRRPTRPTSTWRAAMPGTVMLEGATLSEGRGTTRPLELFGAPDIDAPRGDRGDARPGAAVARRLHAARHQLRADLPQACRTACAAACTSTPRATPTTMRRSSRGGCRRWRSRRSARLFPDYDLWRDFPYEYAFGKLPIDVINGGPGLREWVDDAGAEAGDLDALARARRGGVGRRAQARSCSTRAR